METVIKGGIYDGPRIIIFCIIPLRAFISIVSLSSNNIYY